MSEKTNIEANIRELKMKFNEIKNMNYVQSVRKGPTGVGATFEYLIGKKEDRLDLPDFKGIEIKTKRGYSKSLINLFNAAPRGKTTNEPDRIKAKYGYPDKNDKSLKRFLATINAKEATKVGVFYKFKLTI